MRRRFSVWVRVEVGACRQEGQCVGERSLESSRAILWSRNLARCARIKPPTIVGSCVLLSDRLPRAPEAWRGSVATAACCCGCFARWRCTSSCSLSKVPAGVLSALRERDGVLAASEGKERDAASDGTTGGSSWRSTMAKAVSPQGW